MGGGPFGLNLALPGARGNWYDVLEYEEKVLGRDFQILFPHFLSRRSSSYSSRVLS